MIETYEVKRRPRWWLRISLLTFVGLLLVAGLFWWQTLPTSNFPTGSGVTISRGLSASEIVKQLEAENVIKSSLFAHIVLVAWHDPSNIKAGSYYFDQPISTFDVIDRITRDADGNTLVRVTLPEGFTVREYSIIAAEVLPKFDGTEFLNMSTDSEGKLFPDTYYVPADFTAPELRNLLMETREQKLAEIQGQISTHTLGESGVITLASLLEREANTEESMRIISGILQERLKSGMRLQTDASIEYVLGRPLNELTAEDLERDTPYNTYKYSGLPPTPIGNPGLTAINAVLNPEKTGYLYYITDSEGNFHYAKTFDEHRENIAKYLK